MGRWLVLAAALVGAAGCGEETNPLFCDATHPCGGGARPFCDIEGVYPQSGGIKNTCIAYPFDGGGNPPDGGGEPDGPIGGSDGRGTTRRKEV